jgi:hypothetical protein
MQILHPRQKEIKTLKSQQVMSDDQTTIALKQLLARDEYLCQGCKGLDAFSAFPCYICKDRHAIIVVNLPYPITFVNIVTKINKTTFFLLSLIFFFFFQNKNIDNERRGDGAISESALRIRDKKGLHGMQAYASASIFSVV